MIFGHCKKCVPKQECEIQKTEIYQDLNLDNKTSSKLITPQFGLCDAGAGAGHHGEELGLDRGPGCRGASQSEAAGHGGWHDRQQDRRVGGWARLRQVVSRGGEDQEEETGGQGEVRIKFFSSNSRNKNVQGDNPYKMFLLRMLVAQEKESKLSLDRTLAAIDKVTSESLDGYRFFGSNIRVTSSSKLLILIFQAQNLMEVKNKLRAKLLIASGGEDTSPLRPSPSSSRPRSCSSCRSRRSPTRTRSANCHQTWPS